jgi:hypothetical protein
VSRSGYVKLYRQIEESEFYFSEKFTKTQAWIDLLLLATYKPRTVFIRGIEIKLQPGELCWSQLSLAKRWRWNFKTVVSFLRQLEKREMLETKTNNVTTLIAIKNWPRYQENGEQTGDQKGEQKETRTETNKKVKKGKKIVTTERLTQAEEIYSHYAERVRAGAREDAVRNVVKLLEGFSREILIHSIDRYADNGMSPEKQYRIQANNFFGQKARFKEYLPDGAGEKQPETQLTKTEEILLKRRGQDEPQPRD